MSSQVWDDDFNDLNEYNATARPEHQFRAGLSTLGDGDYSFRFVDACPSTINDVKVCRAGLEVNGGRVIEHVWWLGTEADVNGFLADLMTLGFDSDLWGARTGRKIGDEMAAAVRKLPGVRFHGTKRTDRPQKGPHAGKTFQRLYVNGLVRGPSASVAPAPSAPAANGVPALAGVPATDDIPF